MVFDTKTLSEITASTAIFYQNPLGLLRILILAEYSRKEDGYFHPNKIPYVLASRELHGYLHRYGIPSIEPYEQQSLRDQIVKFHQLFPDVERFQAYINMAFPYCLKNPYVIDLLKGYPLSLYTCLYCLIDSAGNYSGEELIKGANHIHSVYIPKMEMWASLGIRDTDVFVECWKSVAYFESIEEDKPVPPVLQTAIKVYRKHKVPMPILLTHFVRLASQRSTLAAAQVKGQQFNPWEDSQKKYRLPMIERGMTIEEMLFNSIAMKLVADNIMATDVVNALFYTDRSDSMVEKYILFPAVQMDIGFAQNVLVVNPSPDFLVQYSGCALTAQKRTTFVITDSTVAEAYSIQFEKYPYSFVASKDFTTSRNSLTGMCQGSFDYMIVMARDSKLSDFTGVFSHCTDHARVVCFLPQTAITTKASEDNITEILNANRICVDNIMDVPSQLSFSGKRKKMIVRAHVSPQPSTHFALLSSTCFSPKTPAGKRGKKRKSARNRDGITKHYTVVVPSSLWPPYDWLGKHYTIKQLYTRLDEYNYQKAVEAGSIKPYDSGRSYSFSKEITIRINLYPKFGGGYRARAYRQYASDQYGHAERRKHPNDQSMDDSPCRLTRTPYFEPTGDSLQEIYTSIDKWVCSPDITSLIARDLRAHYASHPCDLSLKSVWYCTKEELQSTYMSYNDSLAVQIFCGKNQTLSNLSLYEVTEERVMEALQLTMPGAEKDSQYRRLLDLIFRVAVKRGYTTTNPIVPAKTTPDQEQKEAMRQLRDALTKESLEYHQIFKILKYLLAPVDNEGTPRAVKNSIWLVPLIRLCTGMPLREICALRWKDFQQISDCNAYQLYVTRLMNDANEVISITTYQHAKRYRKVPCPTILSHILLQRQQYLTDHYGITLGEALANPIVLPNEPIAKHVGRKSKAVHCTLSQGRKVSREAIQEAQIPKKVITLLDGEESFLEDLNTTRNDLYRSNFIHHANWVCGLSESELCHIIGRKMPSCYAEHYVDHQNDFMQLDMIQRLDRLWYVVCQSWQRSAEYSSAEMTSEGTHTVVSHPSAGQLASVDLHVSPIAEPKAGDIIIRIESDHGVDGTISAIP